MKGYTHFVEILYGTLLSILAGQFRILFILAHKRFSLMVIDMLFHAQHITKDTYILAKFDMRITSVIYSFWRMAIMTICTGVPRGICHTLREHS
jgi:hypothetical protein